MTKAADIAPLIKRVARGKHGSEHLNQEESRFIFSELLKPDADLLQLGAFLIAQRMKGETSAELAGFIQASREHIANFGTIKGMPSAVDLPCYAGKRRAAHIYLAAALQCRDAGIPIFVHGVESIESRITAWQILEKEGVQRANSLTQAYEIMQGDGLVYMDLAEISPDLHRIYQLRPRLGVRSFANTVARLLNPMQCEGQLNGFFHTPYANYMAEANVLLGQNRSLIFMGAEGEPELYADRQKIVKMQVGPDISDMHFEDCGHMPYPRIAKEPLYDLFDEFSGLLLKYEESRELSTLQRMKSAFLWASGKDKLNNLASL
ncbi:MAG: anthranilate phosphoribosyltransferase [Mariprofundaceae bacterium]|nr:anthranilate phosphoribosyltransferase [Mariprofundaceae bacterium]